MLSLPSIPPVDAAARAAAIARQAELTKPAGSLGRLESLSVQLAGITGLRRPPTARRAVIVMAADHGIAREGVSAYPPEVTAQMVLNFAHGGAAVNVLARQAGARVVVVDMGVASDLPPLEGVLTRRIADGTRSFLREPAMDREQAEAAVLAGIAVVNAEIDAGLDLVATGDMGIGNTTASAAITAVITGRPPSEVTGRGTGLDDAALAAKVAVIERALALHRPDPADAIGVLAAVGGFEIGGLAGVIIGAAARRVPVIVDGFISGAAALIATGLAPAVRPYLVAGHRSVEAGHGAVLRHLDLEPVLDLDLRLGEGTGAVLAFGIVEAAVRILDEMATFADAGVSGKEL
jgi:nicotinate-nucleotide--dimethylbenzimidazole phosphoribosyltransferase